jgi:membrane fusion protein (multidrug efflux system)
MIFMLMLVALIVGSIAYYKYKVISGKIAAYAHFKLPPTAVTSLVAKTTTWQPILSCVGSLKAVNGVEVSTDLAGVVSQIAFESGASVKKGDPGRFRHCFNRRAGSVG